jgi:putative DNA primase/helicase
MKDWNDAHRAGINIRELADKAWSEPKPKQNEADKSDGLVIICAADVEPIQVEWIWQDRLARGKLTLLTGNPDVGKSQVAADMAARVTKGKHWPNGALAPIGDVVILASEDAINDTWVPRLMAADADLTRVHFVKMVIGKDGRRRTFNLQQDIESLAGKIAGLNNVQLVIIDPVTSYLGKVDSHRTNEVRAVMEPVTDFAERSHVAILAITHPPKAQATAMNAFTGSLAFVAASRIAFLIIEEPETGRRLMLPVKNNVGPKAQGRGYSIVAKMVTDRIDAPHVVWDDAPVDVTADQAIAAAAANIKDPGALDAAMDFLREALANGAVLCEEIKEQAKAANIKDRTVRRARESLRVVFKKDGFQGQATWALPENGRPPNGGQQH